MRIAGVETRRYAVPFEPPVKVAWDPVPRARQEATLVIVHSDEGVDGYASGDALPDRAQLERLLVGLDPFRTEVVREICETVDLHGSRPWTLEVAVWDLAGRALDVPCWRLLGGRNEPLRTDDVDGYAALRARTDVRLAAGEFVRSAYEARDLVLRGGVDVVQCDAVLVGGFGGCRRVAPPPHPPRPPRAPPTWADR